jgi:hypothetical protein
MKKKIFVAFIFIAFATLALWKSDIWKNKTAQVEPAKSKKKPIFFVPLKIARFCSANLPEVEIEIEDKKYMVMLDLGFVGNLSLLDTLVEDIKKKTPIKTTSRWGFKGEERQANIYHIPEISIGRLIFNNVKLETESETDRQNTVVLKTKNSSTDHSVGKLGWNLFNNITLFLDLGRDNIAICDSLETFKLYGCPLDSFIKVPFYDDRNLIEFEAITPKGPLRCMLDSGSTCNFINQDLPKGKSIQSVIKDKKRFIEFSTFHLGSQNFGKTVFRPLPIDLPIHIEAILGMDFLFNHRVFIDFKNNEIYFSPNDPL